MRLHACAAAIKRKGKGSDVEEADMDAVVHAHNSKCLASNPSYFDKLQSGTYELQQCASCSSAAAARLQCPCALFCIWIIASALSLNPHVLAQAAVLMPGTAVLLQQ